MCSVLGTSTGLESEDGKFFLWLIYEGGGQVLFLHIAWLPGNVWLKLCAEDFLVLTFRR